MGKRPGRPSRLVILATTSKADKDIAHSDDNDANAFVTRPVDFTPLLQAVRQVDDLFLSVARLPAEGARP